MSGMRELTAEEWDTHWGRIYDDLRAEGRDVDSATEIAEDECIEQFGDRPAEETT